MREVQLPVNPPVLPMLAKRVGELPEGSEWIFEPKWDGFRAIVFRDGEEIQIQSRDEKPLNRYFPELVDALRT
jgi:ATP-dependent DNA ligase